MRVFILILICFISLSSSGQIISASSPYRVRATASCSYMLDEYSGAAAAYSLRKLDCNYAGSAIRVRRSSDNTESDIGFTVSGDLDTSALKTFVGTGGTDYGFVVTWYDQSGNSRNATQSTEANQPMIINGGIVVRQNSLPSIEWAGGSDRLDVSSFTFAQPTTHFLVGKNNGTNDKHFIDGLAGQRQLIGVSGGNLIIFSGSVLTFAANNTNFNLHTAIFNGTSSSIERNNSGAVTGNAGTSAMSAGVRLGSGGVDNGGITGYISEVVLYASDQTSNVGGIKTNINSYYSIY